MRACPVFNNENSEMLCPQCGFDRSCDYEAYPTFAPVPKGTASKAALQADFEASLRRDECPCCGAHVEGDYCGFCGFHVAGVLGIRSAARVDALAAAHREVLLDDLKDFSVVNYDYRWNPAASRLELHQAQERRLADGKDCHPGIFWTEPMFGQLDVNAYPAVDLLLSYRSGNARKTLRVTVPTVRTDNFWRIGLLIRPDLRLQVFLGEPTKFSVSEPVMLDLN